MFIIHEQEEFVKGFLTNLNNLTDNFLEYCTKIGNNIEIIEDTKDYKIGDIITFMHEEDTIPTTHRIVGIDEDGNFVTKGDNNNTGDTLPVTMDEIYGEKVLVIENFGLFLDWIKNGGGLIYVIAFIVIIGAGIYVIKKVKQGKVYEAHKRFD